MIPVPAARPIANPFMSYSIRPNYFLLYTMDIILQHFTQITLPSHLLRGARGTLRKFSFFRGTLELEDKVNLSLSSHWGHRGVAEVWIIAFLNPAIAVKVTPRLLHSRKEPIRSTEQEAELPPKRVWTFLRREESLASATNRAPNLRTPSLVILPTTLSRLHYVI
jgi:hypothetical protein